MTAEEQLSENFKRAVRLLVVEDEEKVAAALRTGLERDGYEVVVEGTGEDACFRLGKEGFDAVVLDLNLPGWDGLEVLTTMRQQGLDVPVLVLTARDSLDDRVVGLAAGADDSLVKPFAFAELLARREALGRRPQGGGSTANLALADLELDPLARTVKRGGEKIELKPREFQILEYLMRHQGHVVTRTMLLEAVWDYHFDPETNVIDVHISRLRQKIDKGFESPLLHTVRGAGYVLRAGD